MTGVLWAYLGSILLQRSLDVPLHLPIPAEWPHIPFRRGGGGSNGCSLSRVEPRSFHSLDGTKNTAAGFLSDPALAVLGQGRE
jgi:hypothetical protein